MGVGNDSFFEYKSGIVSIIVWSIFIKIDIIFISVESYDVSFFIRCDLVYCEFIVCIWVGVFDVGFICSGNFNDVGISGSIYLRIDGIFVYI